MRSLQTTDFDFNGPLGCEGAVISHVGTNHFKVIPGHAPEHPEWANMVNFTIYQGALGNVLRLDVAFPGGSSMAFNSYSYSFSYDGELWRPVHWEHSEKDSAKGDSLLFPAFEQDRVYVGHQVPLSYEKMAALLENFADHRDAELLEIGTSLGGRSLLKLVVTSADSLVPLAKRPVHYLANQHPGEHNAQWRMIGMIEWLLAGGDLARAFLASQAAHFVVMMSPDAPQNGWYRVNAEGVDMNRSYRPDGSKQSDQAHEAYIVQSDLERVATSHPLGTVWGHHTWQGVVEPLITPGNAAETRYGPWQRLRDHILAADTQGRIKPLKKRLSSFEGSWTKGPYEQFGVSAILCEGAGGHYLKSECLEAGRALMEGMARYCTEGLQQAAF